MMYADLVRISYICRDSAFLLWLMYRVGVLFMVGIILQAR